MSDLQDVATFGGATLRLLAERIELQALTIDSTSAYDRGLLDGLALAVELMRAAAAGMEKDAE